MLTSQHRRHVRRSLALTTALASGCLVAGVARAQSLPNVGDATVVAVSGGSAPGISRPGNTLNVDLRATSTVIDWNGFNVGPNQTANFNDDRLLGFGSNIAVLNRDVSGANTQILNNLRSDSNVAVWIYNPKGILIGGGARINTGSLVLTTLAPDQTNFLSGNNYRLTDATGTAADIMVRTGAQITVQGGNRGLIMVAPKIESNGTLTATNQDVAFVTASDVTLNYASGSPLSIVLNKGTAVGGASQIVRGTVSGREALFALASQATVTDALLSVEASVMTATSSERGILLVAGTSGTATPGVSFTGAAADIGGIVRTDVAGALTAQASDGDIRVAGSGAITLGGTLRAGQDVVVGADGAARVIGAVTAGRSYVVTGAGVSLGGPGNVLQQAVSDVTITARDGALSGTAGLTLLSDSNGNGNGALTLATAGTIGGDIALAPGSSLRAGSTGNGDLRIGVGAASNAVALGGVTAGRLLGSVGGAAYGNGLAIDGAMTLGDVDIDAAINLSSGPFSAGAVRSGAGITLASTGAMTLASIDASGPTALSGTGNTTIAGAVTVRGSASNLSILRSGAVVIGGDIAAGNDLTIGAGAVPAAAITTQGTIAARNISFVSSGAQRHSDTIAATGNFGITAGGNVAITSAVTVGGAYQVSGDAVTLGSAGTVTQTANGAVTISGSAITGLGSLTLRSNGDGTGNEALTLAVSAPASSIAPASIAFSPTSSLLGGPSRQSDIQIRSDGTGGIVLGNVAARSLRGAIGVADFADGLVTTGEVRVGDVRLDRALGLTGANVTTGNLISGAGVQLASTGPLTVASIDAGGDVTLTGTGATTLAGLLQARGAGSRVAIDRDGALLLAGVQAGNGIAIGGSVAAASITTTGAVSSGNGLLAISTGAQVWGGPLSAVANVNLSGAGILGGSITAGGSVLLTAGGILTLQSIDAGSGVALRGNGTTRINSLQARGASGAVTVDRDGSLVIDTLQAAGAVAIGGVTAPASLNIGPASIGGGLTAATVGAQNWNGSITTGGGLALSSTVDIVRVTGGLTAQGGIAVTAANDVQIGGAISAVNDVALSGRAFALGDVRSSGGAVSIAATAGGLSAGIVDGAGAVNVTTTGVLNATSVRGGTGVLLGAGSDVALNGALNGGTGGVTVTSATGAVTLVNGVEAAGDYRVSARAITLGGNQTFGGAVTINTTAGTLSGLSGVMLTANNDGVGGEAMTLGAIGGAVSFAGNSVLNGGSARQSAIAITTDGELALGSVNARGLTVNGGQAINGAVSTGNLTLVDDLTLTGSAGGIRTGVIDIAGSLAITATGEVRLNRVVAGGTATITTQTNPADIVIDNGLTATGTVRLTSSRDIRAPFVTSTAGDLFVSATNGSVTGLDGGVSSLNAGPGRSFVLDVGNTVRLGVVTGGMISLRADSIEAISIDAGSNLVDLFADNGNLTISGGVRGGVVSLGSTGVTSIGGAIDASGALTLSGALGLSVGDLRGASVSLNSGAAITTGDILSSGALGVAGSGVTIGDVTAGGLATLTANGGTMTVGALIADGGLDARARDGLTIDSVRVSAGSASVVSTDAFVRVGTAAVSGNFTLAGASVAALPGSVSVGGDYVVRGGRITLGGAGITQRAGGGVALTAGAGGVIGATGTTFVANDAGGSRTFLINSGGAIALAGTAVTTKGGALGLRAGAGATVDFGRIDAGSIGGIVATSTGANDAGGIFRHDAAFTAGDIVARDIAVELSAGALRTGSVTTTGATRLATTAALTTGAVVAGSIDVDAGGALTGGAYTATVGDLSADGGGAVRLGAVRSAGQASLSGGDIEVAGALNAARAALVKARGALTLLDVTAGGALTLDAGSTLTAQALRAGGDTALTAVGRVGVLSLDSGGALGIKGADVSLGSGRATGAAMIDAAGLATLGQMIAGPTLTIRANDAALGGVQRAASVAFENRAGDTSALRLGDGTAADGFRLSDAEVKLVEADALTFRQGTGAVEIGTLAFDGDAGRRSVDILGKGSIAVGGALSGSGTGRRFRLGGDATDVGMASDIRVTATSTAGGRLLFEGADVELRGNRIAVGLAPGFIDALSGAGLGQVVAAFVGNANSALYNANIGGGFYDAARPTTVAARSLTVRYGDYALFQNTGVARLNTGVVLGGTSAAPVVPALTLAPTTPGANAFALFGTINGVGGTATALLGSGVVSVGSANLAQTRINGCLVGSGAGCLAAIVIQPTLQVFETTQADVFGSVESLDVPFDPGVSGSNEELLTGLSALAPRGGCASGAAGCLGDDGDKSK